MTEQAINDITKRYNLRADRADDSSIGDNDRMLAQGWLAGAEYVLAKMGVDFDFDDNDRIIIKGN